MGSLFVSSGRTRFLNLKIPAQVFPIDSFYDILTVKALDGADADHLPLVGRVFDDMPFIDGPEKGIGDP